LAQIPSASKARAGKNSFPPTPFLFARPSLKVFDIQISGSFWGVHDLNELKLEVKEKLKNVQKKYKKEENLNQFFGIIDNYKKNLIGGEVIVNKKDVENTFFRYSGGRNYEGLKKLNVEMIRDDIRIIKNNMSLFQTTIELEMSRIAIRK